MEEIEEKIEKKEKVVVHPYWPNHADGTCYNKFALMSWETGYQSLKKCCGKNFKHKQKECMQLGEEAILFREGVIKPYVIDWGNQGCNQDREPNEWEESYDNLEECCTDHFDWKLETCLGIAPTNDGDGDDGGTAKQTNGNNDFPTERDETYWHPLWQQGHCVTNHDRDPPSYMQNEPEAHMQKTYKECCEVNFVDEPEACLEISEAMAPPTRPPASNEDMTVVKGVKYDQYYYPKYTKNVCELDGNDAPRYMRRDPIT